MDRFDFIIVGAGSAGCVLANRLSADPRARVLLVEAGGNDRQFWIRTPLGYGMTFDDPKVNWKFWGAPDPGTGGRSAYYARGKVLGGSSAINAMVWMRGLPADFDDWGAAGNPGWGGAQAFADYARIETRTLADGRVLGEGPLHVARRDRDHHPVSRVFLEGAREAGFAVIDDLNEAPHEGVAPYAINTHAGRRWSCADAFLRPAMGRPNLAVMTDTLVDRVVIDQGRASAIEVLVRGRRQRLHAAREVILCAGAVGSPAILLRSGVGPAAALAAVGVAQSVDLPGVGENLSDHLGINYHYRANRHTLNRELGTRHGQLLAGLRYLATRGGPVSLSMNQIGGLVRSRPDLARPDMQLYCNPISYTAERSGRKQLLRPDPWQGFILSFNACRPTSRGRITIASADPHAPPVIAPNYLSTGQDCADAIAGARLVARLAQAPAIRAMTARSEGFDPAGANDEAILDDFRARSGTVHHLSGTCRMAPREQGGVVDHRLRVHGVAGLRVIDASIFPTIPSANTHAPTVMTAWRGANLMLEPSS